MDGAKQIVIQTLDMSSREEEADYGVIQGENPLRLEAIHIEANAETTLDYAGNSGDLGCGLRGNLVDGRDSPGCP